MGTQVPHMGTLKTVGMAQPQPEEPACAHPMSTQQIRSLLAVEYPSMSFEQAIVLILGLNPEGGSAAQQPRQEVVLSETSKTFKAQLSAMMASRFEKSCERNCSTNRNNQKLMCTYQGCMKTFRKKSNMFDHQLMHLGFKLFSCVHC